MMATTPRQQHQISYVYRWKQIHVCPCHHWEVLSKKTFMSFNPRSYREEFTSASSSPRWNIEMPRPIIPQEFMQRCVVFHSVNSFMLCFISSCWCRIGMLWWSCWLLRPLKRWSKAEWKKRPWCLVKMWPWKTRILMLRHSTKWILRWSLASMKSGLYPSPRLWRSTTFSGGLIKWVCTINTIFIHLNNFIEIGNCYSNFIEEMWLWLINMI